MELTGKLKEQIEKAETREEAKKVIEEAGISLTDEGLEKVAGGGGENGAFCSKNPEGPRKGHKWVNVDPRENLPYTKYCEYCKRHFRLLSTIYLG